MQVWCSGVRIFFFAILNASLFVQSDGRHDLNLVLCINTTSAILFHKPNPFLIKDKTFHCLRRKCNQRQGIGPWWLSVPETDWLTGWGELIDLMTDPSEPQPPFCSLRRYRWRSLTCRVDTWSNRPLNCQTQGIISSGGPSLGRCRLDDGHVVLMPGETSGEVGGRRIESSPRGVCEEGLQLTSNQQTGRQLSYKRVEDWKHTCN